jgi:hypothetical protein
VDLIILDSPHRIGEIDVNVKKGDRNVMPYRRSPTPRPEEISNRYSIHITNLPANIDAEALSEIFNWNFYAIVMDPSVDDRASPMQCWLRNAYDEREIDNFVRDWNRKVIEGSIIQCKKEEDKLELCHKFQFGQCPKSSDVCHWEHIPCTAQGNCASTCPYGHRFGMKPEHDSPIGKSNFQIIKCASRIKCR